MADDTRDLWLQVQALATQALKTYEPPPTLRMIRVKKGDNLQAALNAAAAMPTDCEVRVYPDTYDGLTAPLHSVGLVTVRPDTDDFPPDGQRIAPIHAPSLIKLRGTVNNSALVVPSGAHNYTFIGLQPLPGADVSYAMIAAGDPTETDPARAAKNLVFDRCYLQADAVSGGKHGISLHCGNVAVLNSYIDDFWAKDDAQAINAYAGPGPFLIANNYTTASGENLIIGGGDPKNAAMRPTSLLCVRNDFTKKVAWRGRKDLTVKNCLELKNLIGGLVEHNRLSNVWADGQAGALVLFTPRNQGGSAPYSSVEGVIFRFNEGYNAGAGIVIQGDDNEAPSGKVNGLQIYSNLFHDIDAKLWRNPRTLENASGRLIQITRGPLNVTIQRNTLLGANLNSWLNLDGPTPADRLQVINNVFSEGKYALLGGEPGVYGVDAWTKFVTNGTLSGNLIARTGLGVDKFKYPDGVGTVATDAVVDAAYQVVAKYQRDGLGVDFAGFGL